MKRILLVASVCLISCQTSNKKDKGKEQETTDGPKLTKPSVRKVWVPPAIEDGGRTYRDGHFIYILDKESTWSK